MRQSTLAFGTGKGKGVVRSRPVISIDLDGSDEAGARDLGNAASSSKKRPSSSSAPSRTDDIGGSSGVDVIASNKKPKSSPSSSRSSSGKGVRVQSGSHGTISPSKEGEGRPSSKPAQDENDSNATTAAKEKAQIGEGNLCHQHRAPCQALIRCTLLRPNGTRCPYKYCSNSLSRVYSQDMAQILSAGRNVPGIDRSQHCDIEDARYLWKCPRCRDVCACSMCRKKKGLEPLGQTKARSSTAVVGAKKKPALAMSPKHQGILSPSKSKATSTQTSASPTRRRPEGPMKQRPLRQHLKPPAAVEKPTLEGIETRLPSANIMERLWLYETLVRFDLFKIPARVLANLDNFDHWTEGMLQTILERLVQSLTGIKSFRIKPSHLASLPRAYRPLVEACSQHLGRIDRGEAWEAARAVLLESKTVRVRKLENIEIAAHQKSEDQPMPSSTMTTDTLLGGRATRSRRLAELSALEKVKAMSRREHEQMRNGDLTDDSSENDAHSTMSEMEWKGVRRGAKDLACRKKRSKRSASARSSSSSSMNASECESDLSDSEGGEVREDRRNKKIRATRSLRQERGDKNGKGHKVSLNGSSRCTEKDDSSSERDIDSNGEDGSDLSDFGDGEMNDRRLKGDVKPNTTREKTSKSLGKSRNDAPRRSSRQVARQANVDIESDTIHQSEDEEKIAEKKPMEPEQRNSPISPPNFETRVAILSALVDLLVQTSSAIGHELVEGAKTATLLERQAKDEVKEMVKTHEEEMKAMSQRAPSMSKHEDYALWKRERTELERRHHYELLDCKVHTQLLIEPHKLRTGPMGTDADGNVYWHVSEYNENMPKDTQGRWAWSLLVLGDQTLMPKEEEKTEDGAVDGVGKTIAAPIKSASHRQSQVDGADGSCLEPCSEERFWMGTNNPQVIEQLKKFIKYRLALKEHAELVADAKQDLNFNVDVSGELATPPPPPSLAEQAARRTQRRHLRESQAKRRENVESLLETLEFTRDYYSWHLHQDD